MDVYVIIHAYMSSRNYNEINIHTYVILQSFFLIVLMFFCQNGLRCQGEDVMALQDNSGTCTSYVAKWPNSGATPTYSTTSGGTWKFSFSNGGTQNGCDSGRKLDVAFVCSSSVCFLAHFFFQFFVAINRTLSFLLHQPKNTKRNMIV